MSVVIYDSFWIDRGAAESEELRAVVVGCCFLKYKMMFGFQAWRLFYVRIYFIILREYLNQTEYCVSLATG